MRTEHLGHVMKVIPGRPTRIGWFPNPHAAGTCHDMMNPHAIAWKVPTASALLHQGLKQPRTVVHADAFRPPKPLSEPPSPRRFPAQNRSETKCLVTAERVNRLPTNHCFVDKTLKQ